MKQVSPRHWLVWVSLLLALAARGGAEPAPPPDPLLSAIPADATFVAIIDLRQDSPTAKSVAGMQTPEQAALVRAAIHLGLQQFLTLAAPGVRLEEDVLPWLTRRAALCTVPLAAGGTAQILLIETAGGTAAGAGFERLVQAGVQAGRLAAHAPVAGVPAWQQAPQGFILARQGSLLVVGEPEPAVVSVLQLMQAKPAPAAGPVALTLGRTPPGILRLAARFAPRPAQQQGQMALKGVSGASLSVRLEAEALVADGSLLLEDEQRAALAGLKATFGESVAGIPETAAAVLVASRPAPAFHTLGLPFADVFAQGMFGAPPLRPMGEVLGPIVSDVMSQEVAVALMPSANGVSWLAAMTSAQPATLLQRVQQFVQAGQGAEGVTWTAVQVGDLPAWSIGLKTGPERTTTIHFAVAGARLLVSGDRQALEAGAAALAGKGKPVTACAWYPQAKQEDQAASWMLCADVGAVGRVVSSLIAQHARVSQPHVAQLAAALLAGIRSGSIRAGVDGNGIRALLQVGIDPAKMARLGATMPAAAALAAVFPAFARARGQARGAACTSNMKQLCLAALMYAQDWDEQLPPADWVKALTPYTKNPAILHCPLDGQQHPCSYALNKNLAQLPMAQIAKPAETILFYETTSADPAPCGTGEDMVARHNGGVVLGFADGHVKLHDGAIRKDWWDPAAQPK